MKQFHQPVLLKEAINFLNIKPGEVYIDATVGGAGHTLAILKKGGKVFGIDRDPEAVSFSKKRLSKTHFCDSCQIIQANFADLEKIIEKYQVPRPSGILLDLGVSLHQLKSKGRGFSFLEDEPLDMRMNPQLAVSAADLINCLNKGELNELFSRFGEEKLSLPIAKNIVLVRKEEPIRTTRQLAHIVVNVYKKKYKEWSRIHPATKTFQALRIAVNDELNNLEKVLSQAIKVLKNKGRLAVISFHGLEDKIVKEFFKKGAEKKWLEILTKKPIVPLKEEIKANPRSRSAKLRCAQKI